MTRKCWNRFWPYLCHSWSALLQVKTVLQFRGRVYLLYLTLYRLYCLWLCFISNHVYLHKQEKKRLQWGPIVMKLCLSRRKVPFISDQLCFVHPVNRHYCQIVHYCFADVMLARRGLSRPFTCMAIAISDQPGCWALRPMRIPRCNQRYTNLSVHGSYEYSSNKSYEP